MKRYFKPGFTLIEVLFSLLIVGVVVTQVMIISQNGQKAAMMNGQRLQAYFLAEKQRSLIRAEYLDRKFNPPCNQGNLSACIGGTTMNSISDQWKKFLGDTVDATESLDDAYGAGVGGFGGEDNGRCIGWKDGNHNVLANSGLGGSFVPCNEPVLDGTKYSVKVNVYHTNSVSAIDPDVTAGDSWKIGYPIGIPPAERTNYSRVKIRVKWENLVSEKDETVTLDYYLTQGME